MEIQMIRKNSRRGEALDILAQMVRARIQYDETKIRTRENEAEIRMRRHSIRQLEREYNQARQTMLVNGRVCDTISTLLID